jgi:hypothetical protein
VVETGAVAVHERDVVHVRLAKHPCRPQPFIVAIGRRVLRAAEAKALVVVECRLAVGDVEIAVIEAHDLGPPVEVVALEQRGQRLHLVKELDGKAEGILHPQRATLRKLHILDPRWGAALCLEIGGEMVEVALRPHPE